MLCNAEPASKFVEEMDKNDTHKKKKKKKHIEHIIVSAEWLEIN